MCFLVSGLSQASGIKLVYEPAYIKSKQFITADFPWSCLTVVPLVSQLPAPESLDLNPWLLTGTYAAHGDSMGSSPSSAPQGKLGDTSNIPQIWHF